MKARLGLFFFEFLAHLSMIAYGASATYADTPKSLRSGPFTQELHCLSLLENFRHTEHLSSSGIYAPSEHEIGADQKHTEGLLTDHFQSAYFVVGTHAVKGRANTLGVYAFHESGAYFVPLELRSGESKLQAIQLKFPDLKERVYVINVDCGVTQPSAKTCAISHRDGDRQLHTHPTAPIAMASDMTDSYSKEVLTEYLKQLMTEPRIQNRKNWVSTLRVCKTRDQTPLNQIIQERLDSLTHKTSIKRATKKPPQSNSGSNQTRSGQ